MPDFDLIVIGAGPAGYVAAIRAAQLGADVLVVEERELGGTCLNRGCIPSKALIYCAQLLEQAEGASRVGITFGEPDIDMDGIRSHADRCVKQLVAGVRGLFKSNNIMVARGRARLGSPTEVTVEADDGRKKTVSANYILVATGSEPMIIPVSGVDGDDIFTSDEAVTLPGPFDELVIVGGGAVGCEFAYVYSQLGTKVTLLEMMGRIVPTEDPEVTEILARSLKKAGVDIKTDARCVAVEDEDEGKRVLCEIHDERLAVDADAVFMAAGRRAITDEIGLDAIGVETDDGKPVVDESMQTSVDSVFAAGDCLRGVGLAHEASEEGIVAVENMFGDGAKMNYDAVPAAIYTHPQVASVGVREHEADERGLDVKTGVFEFAANGKASAIGQRDGLVKLVADAESGVLIGASAVGPEVTELIAEIVFAVRTRRTANELAETIHAHPTLSEVVREAALDVLDRPIHK